MSDDTPEKLNDLIEMFRGFTDRTERIQALIDLGNKFREVPAEVAKRPFDESQRVPACESEAFVFVVPNDDGTPKFYFAVENPQGISAMATAVILDRCLSGAPADQVANVSPEFIYDLFGRELSMGKNMGLTNMVNMCVTGARRFAGKA